MTKKKKELTFTDPEGGKTYKCYVNSMQSLVNFMKYFVPLFGEPDATNVYAAFLMCTSIIGENDKIIKKYIKLPITASGVPLGSYVQWLKISVEAAQILDNLKNVNGTWSSVYSLSGLTAGKTY